MSDRVRKRGCEQGRSGGVNMAVLEKGGGQKIFHAGHLLPRTIQTQYIISQRNRRCPV